jgi:hypothetical protein
VARRRQGVLMSRRSLLVALLVGSTAAFVIGVSVERSSADTHTEPAPAAHAGEAGESSGEHAAEEGASEGHVEGGQPHTDEGASESFFGIDYEAAPFVALAVAFSLALATAVWLRPGWALLLVLVALVMVAFAALDVREIVHQLDESKGGLAVLAAVVAVLHLAAAAVAGVMSRAPATA